MYLKKQSFLVLGLSRSGEKATEFLLSHGAVTYIYDDIHSERVEQMATALEKMGAKRVKAEELGKASEYCDALVLSPGIPIDHPLAVAFKRNGKAVIGESELAARYLRCPMVAITGTNGKTTTVSMLEEVLNKGGISAKACGNIGSPMIGFVGLGEDEVAVAEISSFQLETLNSFCPHVAMVLNVSEDHLNRHYNMENYLFLKSKILKNLTETEYAVLNYDDPQVRSFSEKTKAKVLYFSVKEKVRGAYYEKGDLYFGKEKIVAVSDLPFDGLHNIQNALATIIGAKLFGVKTENIVSALKDFKGIKHRIEFVDEVNGVRYINDSKGTNVDATLKAVSTLKSETILLLGGKNKGYDYGKLFSAIMKSNVVHTVLYGENRYELLSSARQAGFDKVTVCHHFEFAVKIAAMMARCGQTVLLSPASASFDEFSGYEERGDRFAEMVRSLTKKEEEIEENGQDDIQDGDGMARDAFDGVDNAREEDE